MAEDPIREARTMGVEQQQRKKRMRRRNMKKESRAKMRQKMKMIYPDVGQHQEKRRPKKICSPGRDNCCIYPTRRPV